MARLGKARRPSLIYAFGLAVLVSSCMPSGFPQPTQRLALPVHAATLDPALHDQRYAEELFRLLYLRLLSVDPHSGRMVPQAATEWDVSDDGLVVTFRLRDDLRFASGRPVTAADAARAIRRLLDPRLGSELGPLLYSVVGARETHAAVGNRELGIEAPSPTLLVIRVVEPAPELPATLAQIGYITAVGDDGLTLEPEYSGAYKVEDAAGEVLLLSPNLYHLDGEPPPLLMLHRAGSPARARRLFESGRVDALVLDSSETAPNVTADRTATPIAVVHHLLLNGLRSPTDDVFVRRALAETVGVLDSLLPDGAVALPAIAAPGTVAAPRGIETGGNEGLARNYLRQAAGYRDAAIRVGYSVGPVNQAVVESIAARWRDSLGLAVDTAAYTRSDLIDAVKAGDLNVLRIGHASKIPDAGDVFESLFLSPDSWAGPSDKRVDAAIERARSAWDISVRARAYRRAQTILMEELAVVIPLYGEQRITYRRPTK